MFIYNPKKRIKATEALCDQYFNDFDKSSVPAFNEEIFGIPRESKNEN